MLGGSFNPAHDGHLHVSREALKHIDLDYIWWVVSPQNPLKSSDNMANIRDRLQYAKTVACDPRIRVSDIEVQLDTRFTIDTMQKIKTSFPEKKFVWIMGADNLIQFPKWANWQKLFTTVPIAIFDRAPYSVRALSGKAAQVFSKSRIKKEHARKLADFSPPAWAFFQMPLHSATATKIRASRGPSSS